MRIKEHLWKVSALQRVQSPISFKFSLFWQPGIHFTKLLWFILVTVCSNNFVNNCPIIDFVWPRILYYGKCEYRLSNREMCLHKQFFVATAMNCFLNKIKWNPHEENSKLRKAERAGKAQLVQWLGYGLDDRGWIPYRAGFRSSPICVTQTKSMRVLRSEIVVAYWM